MPRLYGARRDGARLSRLLPPSSAARWRRRSPRRRHAGTRAGERPLDRVPPRTRLKSVVGEGATIEILDDQARELQHVAAPRRATHPRRRRRPRRRQPGAAGREHRRRSTASPTPRSRSGARRSPSTGRWPGTVRVRPIAITCLRRLQGDAQADARRPAAPDPGDRGDGAALGLPVLEIQGMEADDVDGHARRARRSERLDVVLVTSDKDMLQLVNDRIRLYQPVGPTSGGRTRHACARARSTWVDRDAVIEKWGVTPEQIRDVLALMGDSIDNIPGVAGVGAEDGGRADLAIRLDGRALRAARRGGEEGADQKLATHREQALRSRASWSPLATELDLPVGWEDLTVRPAPARRAAGAGAPLRAGPARAHRATKRCRTREVGFTPVGAARRRRAGSAATGAGATQPARASATCSRRASRPPRARTSEPRPFESSAASVGDRHAAGTSRTGAASSCWSADAPRVEDCEARLEAVRARAAPTVSRLFPVIDSGRPRTRAGRRPRIVGARRHRRLTFRSVTRPACVSRLEQVRERLGAVLADPGVPKIGEDLKVASHALADRSGSSSEGLELDLHVGSVPARPRARSRRSRRWRATRSAVALPAARCRRRASRSAREPAAGRVAASGRARGRDAATRSPTRCVPSSRPAISGRSTARSSTRSFRCCSTWSAVASRSTAAVLVEMSRQSGQEIARLEGGALRARRRAHQS